MIRQVAARRLLFLSNSSFKYVIHWETENTHTNTLLLSLTHPLSLILYALTNTTTTHGEKIVLILF